MSRSTRAAVLASTAALAVSGLAACGTSSADTDKTDAASATCPNGEIRFGIEPYEAPAKLKPAYDVLAKALSKKLDCPVELLIVDNYTAEVEAMKHDKLELAQFGPLGYVFAAEHAGAEAIASFGTAEGELSTYTGGIWVAKDSPIQSVEDLEGKTLALSEPGSTSGDALPTQALREAGLEDGAVKVTYAGGHPEALLALTNGKVDAAEINSQQLATAEAEGAFDPSGYRQVWTSEPIPNDPITVRGNLDPAFKEAVKEALLNLSPEDVAKVGAFLDVDPAGPLLEVDEETYRPLFDLAETLGLTEKDV
jgi:phosphonate transport system substrate-binding protein